MATNSALTLGMRHSFFCHGLRAFVQPPADPLVGRGGRQPHHLPSQKAQGPVVMAFRCRTAGQRDQVGLALAFSPASLSMRTAASGFFQKSGPACSRLSLVSSRSICSGLKPRGCRGCQLPGLCGGRSPAVSFLCVPIYFSSSLRASWAFCPVQCSVEAARVERPLLRPGTPGPTAFWPPPGRGR